MRTVTAVKVIAIFCVACRPVASMAQRHAGEVVVPRAPSAVTVDGRADEAAWRKAAAIGPLLTIRTMGKPGHDLTYARLLYDDKALYVAVTCTAPPAEAGRKQARDTHAVFETDHIEIFLSPFPDTGDYYQLVVDRSGNVRDVWHTQRKSDRAGAGWNGGFDGS